ncbi:lysine exporter LysO family protein [Desulfotruncus alcoholivorax]|uniref:lysine exporter LysO family protein n=1 Tax=Desulfotruncus alcoholivorax TaxID=265477 RepID=UPI0004296EFC|nr:lysine exporter LysO family protein [Desulfotruncus alcoholivorax]
MTFIVVGAILAGALFGYWILPAGMLGYLDQATSLALCIMLVGVGIDLGSQRQTWLRLRALGWKILLVPVLVAVGSLAGAVAGGTFLGMPFNESSAIGAGFGWYSLSGVLIAKIYSVETGALAFLTNVSRELLAFVLIPVLAAKFGNLVAVSPGGATTMDTTLPLIAKATDADTTVIAVVNGTILSSLVPFLVPVLIHL